MSAWQPYTDGLVASGKMHSATILGLADASYWAYSGPSCPQPAEAAHIIACVADSDKARASGVTVAGTKFFVLRADKEEGIIYGKQGASGICVSQTAQCVVIGVYGEGQNAAACNMEVEKMTKGFKDAGM
jgi:profilin